MRIVALEEHFTVPGIVAGISRDAITRRGFPGPDFPWAQTIKRAELADLGDARLADMDAERHHHPGAVGRRTWRRPRARPARHRPRPRL